MFINTWVEKLIFKAVAIVLAPWIKKSFGVTTRKSVKATIHFIYPFHFMSRHANTVCRLLIFFLNSHLSIPFISLMNWTLYYSTSCAISCSCECSYLNTFEHVKDGVRPTAPTAVSKGTWRTFSNTFHFHITYVSTYSVIRKSISISYVGS